MKKKEYRKLIGEIRAIRAELVLMSSKMDPDHGKPVTFRRFIPINELEKKITERIQGNDGTGEKITETYSWFDEEE